jgi:hypothetical protein
MRVGSEPSGVEGRGIAAMTIDSGLICQSC